MGDATTLLFGLGGFRVVSVGQQHEHDVEAASASSRSPDNKQICLDCGVLSGMVHSLKLRGSRSCGMAAGPAGVLGTAPLSVPEQRGRRRTFVETSGQVGARRLTRRLVSSWSTRCRA